MNSSGVYRRFGQYFDCSINSNLWNFISEKSFIIISFIFWLYFTVLIFCEWENNILNFRRNIFLCTCLTATQTAVIVVVSRQVWSDLACVSRGQVAGLDFLHVFHISNVNTNSLCYSWIYSENFVWQYFIIVKGV